MDEPLREQMIATLFRLKRLRLGTPHHTFLPPGEAHALLRIKRFQDMGKAGDLFSYLHMRLFLSKPAVSQILNALERKGMITRTIDPADRRRIHVRLTDQAEYLVGDIHQSVDQQMELLVSQFGEADAAAFVELGNRFAALAGAISERPEGGEPID